MHKKQAKKAFSLIELSIVILIVSILITGSIGASKTAINNGKSKITSDRMTEIYKALTNFVANNRRLPCPAIITIAKGETYTPSGGPTYQYGQETGSVSGTTVTVNSGSCTNAFTSTNATNLVYGMIPTIALGLSPDMAEDGFGVKFSYFVDNRFTKTTASTSSTDGFEYIKGTAQDTGTTPTIITIKGPSGTTIINNALFVIISHGANGYYGFNATGTSAITVPSGSTASTDESKYNNYLNNNNTGSGTSSLYGNDFVVYSTNQTFDDVVLYKTKTQLLMDAGLEMAMCSFTEISNNPVIYTLSSSKNYGSCICSSNTTSITTGTGRDATTTYYAGEKTCGKYGIWSALNKVSGTSSELAISECETNCP